MTGDENAADRDMRSPDDEQLDRREFINEMLAACGTAAPVLLGVIGVPLAARAQNLEYDPTEHSYGMGIDIQKCIGCGRCVQACTTENEVPEDPHFTNTWIERYIIRANDEVEVDSIEAGMHGFPPPSTEQGILKTFFVPKLCNHCEEAPCVQVCPVGATFTTQDGVVLVDDDYCIGCRYEVS
jgi:Fe-S-cluster-containing dehydrogenase component